MEDQGIILYSSLAAILLSLAFKFLFLSKTRHKNLPPSPPSLPIISHLHLLKPPIHHALLKLSQKYGPIMSLKLGSCRELSSLQHEQPENASPRTTSFWQIAPCHSTASILIMITPQCQAPLTVTIGATFVASVPWKSSPRVVPTLFSK
ncbi:hypothetical protein SLE2022_275260 [Rubroshorea leprosula]